ncbi:MULTISPECIES: hypothetical protein [Flavobacteriaceae]|uniref:hypothetical protein n=1 Tax=Flavobacteriaceae TaxID=49546 RepID=UPI0014912BC2|nr:MULTISPECIES: hypothetical protein [Allomuricauda]MDC6367773.1 hypothetical protein [Muricauda sp. AC10]
MSASLSAQKIEFDLDYTATYVLSKSKDTVTVSIGNGGKYLYTDSRAITKKLSSSFSKLGLKENDPNSRIKLLINLINLDMLMYIKAESNVIAASVNLENFIPKESVRKETIELISESTQESIEVMGKDFPIVAIFPKSKPDQKIYAAFDDEYDLDYNQNFRQIFRSILGKAFDMEIPHGAIVYLRNKEEILRLLHIENDRKKGAIDFSLTIE